jgi:REP-associated tyrosine transposase
MMYRRAKSAGGTFFFTVNLANRSSRLLTDHIDVLRKSVCSVRESHPMDIVAMVVLPDHLHAVWTMPPQDSDYSLRWSLIKAGFSRNIVVREPVSGSRRHKRERGIWQRRFWEHQIRDESDFARHVDYIHFNPVKHEYVTAPVEWPHSSIHRFIHRGILTPDWAAGLCGPDLGFGERR